MGKNQLLYDGTKADEADLSVFCKQDEYIQLITRLLGFSKLKIIIFYPENGWYDLFISLKKVLGIYSL